MYKYIEVTSPKKLLKNSILHILSSNSIFISFIIKFIFSFSPFKLMHTLNFLLITLKFIIKLFHSFSTNFFIDLSFIFLIIKSPDGFKSIFIILSSEIIILIKFTFSFLFPKYSQILKLIFIVKL